MVLTLRGDFYGRALEDRALADLLQDALVNISPMQQEELRRAILEPAKSVGLRPITSSMTLTADDVDEMQRELRELVGETGPLKIGTASFWMRATFGTTWRLLAAQPSYYRSAVFFSPRFHEPCRRVGAQWGT